MSKLFLADPAALRQKSDKLDTQRNMFGQNVKKMYDTLHRMVTSNYVSPAAKALAVKIDTYHDDMDAMTKIIGDYSTFCMTASNKVVKNEESIIDTFKNKPQDF